MWPISSAHAGDQAARIDWPGLQHLAAGESQHAGRQPGGALDRSACDTDVAGDLAGAALLDAPFHQVQAASDALKHVVEIMRDAAGELADRFHLLCLAQLLLAGLKRLLGALPGGDVDQDADDAMGAGRNVKPAGDQGGYDAAIAAHVVARQVTHLAMLDEVQHVIMDPERRAGRREIIDPAADHLVLAVAEQGKPTI